MNSESLRTFASALRAACRPVGGKPQDVTVATHISPDPDAIGSAFSMAYLCRALGANPQVYLPEPLPQKFHALVGDMPHISQAEAAARPVLVVVDTATDRRIGEALFERLPSIPCTFNIDHHVSNIGWAGTNHVDARAAAAAQLVWALYSELKVSANPQIANLLYGGILDDTGNFCFSNVTEEALSVAASLVGAGAVPEQVANEIYFSVPERIFRLQALALGKMQLWFGGKAALLVVTKEMLDDTGCTSEDTEGLVDFARRVEGATVAVFFRELEGKWKLSLRSKTAKIDVNSIAARFGGGGHAAAAGATLPGSREEVEDLVRTALADVIV